MEDEETDLGDLGAPCQLAQRPVGAAGAGFGFGDESPDLRLTFGLELRF